MLGKRLGVTPVPRRGGEGIIQRVVVGRRGKIIYNVVMLKDGSWRPVYSKDLIAHHKPKKTRRKRR